MCSHEPATSEAPAINDMIHTHGSSELYLRTKEVVSTALRPLGLSWQRDVVQVYPVPDIFLKHLSRNVHARYALAISGKSRAEIQDALIKSADPWSLHRTLVVQLDETQCLFVEIRSTARWWRHSITEHMDTIANASQLEDLARDELLDLDTRPGRPLFNAVLVPMNLSTTGVIITINHAIFDGLSITKWAEDLSLILLMGEAPKHRLPYKLFADTYYNGRGSPLAETSITSLTKLYSGLGQQSKIVWPEKRGDHLAIGSVDLRDDDTIFKRNYSIPEAPRWSDVDGQERELPFLPDLLSQHAISPVIIMKTALALFIISRTRGDCAIFGDALALRQWPFLPESLVQASELPNPLDVAGPTYSSICRVVHIDREARIVDLFRQAKSNEDTFNRHAHAPPAKIFERLDEKDRAVFDLRFRHLFDWLPSIRMGSEASMLISTTYHSMNELAWMPSLLSPTVVKLELCFYENEYSRDEVKDYVRNMLDIAEWIHKPQNFYRPVSECLHAFKVT